MAESDGLSGPPITCLGQLGLALGGPSHLSTYLLVLLRMHLDQMKILIERFVVIGEVHQGLGEGALCVKSTYTMSQRGLSDVVL